MKKKSAAKKAAPKAPSAKGNKGAEAMVVMPMMFGKKGAKKGGK